MPTPRSLPMTYCIDTEFLEDGCSLTLLSLALVSADGREYYAEVEGVDLTPANAWVAQNVLPHLGQDRACVKARSTIRAELLSFVNDPEPVFWGYFSAFDWVLLTQLIGDFETCRRDAPQWPMLCLDLEQARRMHGFTLQGQAAQSHHALSDARWTMAELKRLGFHC